MADRIVRVVLVGDSGSLVKSFEVAGVAAEGAEAKFTRLKAAGTAMSSVGRVMTGIAAPAVALGAVAVKSATSYQQALTRISTQTNMSAKQADGVASHFSKLSGQVGYSSTQLAQGLYPIASEGLKGTKALQALTAAAKGAQIGGESLTTTADALSGVMGTGAKDIHSASEAMVVMDRIVGLGKMQLTDLTNAMSTGVLSEATKMGLGFRDVGAALSAMTRQGVPAEMEASRLRLTLTKMAAPTGAALQQIQALHLGQFQMASDLRKPNGLILALEALKSHLADVSPNQRNQALANIFGQSRGLGNITGLLRALPTMSNIRDQLGQATASQFGQRWQQQMQTPAQKFANMIAHVKTSVTQLGNALMPIVLAVLPKLTSALSGAVSFMAKMPKPVRDVVAGFVAFLAIGGPILMIAGKMITSFLAVKDALTALKITTELTSTAMKATLVGVLIFAIIELITHWKQVQRVVGPVFSAMGRAAASVGHAIGRVFNGIWSVVKSVIGKIKVLWHDSPLGGLVGAGMNLASGNVSGAASSVLRGASFGLLHNGGPVAPHYLAGGGPVGTDTVPGWLTPGEYVLNRAAVSRVGEPMLAALNNGGGLGGGGGGDIRIEPMPMTINLDSRTIWKGLGQFAASRAARGTGLVGGGMLTGAGSAA